MIDKQKLRDLFPYYWNINEDGKIDSHRSVDFRIGTTGDIVIPAMQLYGFGSVQGNFSCSNSYLTTLKGAPDYVSGDFYASGNLLTHLEDGPKTVMGSYNAAGNNLVSVTGPVIGEFLWCDTQKDNSLSPLAVVMANAKQVIFKSKMDKIINKHLATKDVLALQEELLDAGLI